MIIFDVINDINFQQNRKEDEKGEERMTIKNETNIQETRRDLRLNSISGIEYIYIRGDESKHRLSNYIARLIGSYPPEMFSRQTNPWHGRQIGDHSGCAIN